LTLLIEVQTRYIAFRTCLDRAKQPLDRNQAWLALAVSHEITRGHNEDSFNRLPPPEADQQAPNGHLASPSYICEQASGVRASSLVGVDLNRADFANLEARWIDRRTQAPRSCGESTLLLAQQVGRRGGDFAGIAIPYFAPGSRNVREYRLGGTGQSWS
jgi:hypothetical protein